MFLIGTLLVLAGLALAFKEMARSKRKAARKAYWAGRNRKKAKGPVAVEIDGKTAKASEQLNSVMNANFSARPLLNKPERRLLAVIDQALTEYTPGWRAMGQVSLGEILSSPNKSAFWAINAKRVDLLIVDSDCKPLHAIEFQGTGHHGSAETAARDAIKREALRRAGIGYVEVVTGDTPAEVREMVRKLGARVKIGN